MIPRVACEGAPRDLGADQGAHCRRGVAARLAGLSPGREPALLRRHFPHLAERTEGLATAAGVSRRALVGALVAEVAAVPGRGPLFELEVAGAPDGAARAAIATALPTGFDTWLLRESRPETGYRSFELTRPWLAGSFAGVNAEGLAVAWSPPIRRARRRESAEREVAPLLLVQQCLERLDRVDKAIEWCQRRPAGGRGALLFADRSGRFELLELDGGRRGQRVSQREPKPGDGTPALTLRFLPAVPGVAWSGARSGEIRFSP